MLKMTFFTIDVIVIVTVCEFPVQMSLSTSTMHMDRSVTDPGTCEICSCSRSLLFFLFNSVIACSATNMAAGGRFEYLVLRSREII